MNLGAIEATCYKVQDLGVCWNDCIRNIVGFNRYESVKKIQWHLNEFEFIYDIPLYSFGFLLLLLLTPSWRISTYILNNLE